MSPLLSPAEYPRDPMLKLGYVFTRRQFFGLFGREG